jgi:hypothetical protein
MPLSPAPPVRWLAYSRSPAASRASCRSLKPWPRANLPFLIVHTCQKVNFRLCAALPAPAVERRTNDHSVAGVDQLIDLGLTIVELAPDPTDGLRVSVGSVKRRGAATFAAARRWVFRTRRR